MPKYNDLLNEAGAWRVMADRLRTFADRLDGQAKAAELEAQQHKPQPRPFTAYGIALDESGKQYTVLAAFGDYVWITKGNNYPWTIQATTLHHPDGATGCGYAKLNV